MQALLPDDPTNRFRYPMALSLLRRARRFYEQRSPFAVAAAILSLGSLAIGLQQRDAIHSDSDVLRQASTQLDSAIAKSRAELTALSQIKRVPDPRTERQPLAQQGQQAEALQKALQDKDVNVAGIQFGRPTFDKEKAYWQQDTTVKLSGPYAALKDVLLRIPHSLNNVALLSIKLTRDTTIVQVECEAVFRAYYAGDRNERATPP